MVAPFVAKLQSAGPLDVEDRTLLAELCRDVRSVPPRQDLVREGDEPLEAHLVLDGWACRSRNLADGRRQITAFLLPGDISDAYIALLGHMDHTITTLTECRVAFLKPSALADLLARPAIARALCRSSLVDGAVLREWLINLGRRSALERIAHLICELHTRLESVGLAEGSSFHLPLTQEQLGDALGLTPVHVNRTLRNLREQNIMTFRQQRVDITNMTALRRAAGFSADYLNLRRKLSASSG